MFLIRFFFHMLNHFVVVHLLANGLIAVYCADSSALP